MPEVLPGTILGHEAVGIVVETGPAVTTLTEGDRVLVSCISSCGRCRFCKEGHYGLCIGGGGWILGHTIDGVQAELARIPFADTSLYKVPAELSDEQVLFLADILPTSYEVGVLNGGVTPGDTVAIVGAGPIGLAAILTAKLYTPGRIVAIDLEPSAAGESASQFGADTIINNGTRGRGRADARADRRSRRRRRDRGGRRAGDLRALRRPRPPRRPVANVGVHGHPATLHLEKLWIKDVTITTGLVDTNTTPRLLQLIADGRLDPTVFATHRFALEETMEAYEVFANAGDTDALKVVLNAQPLPLEPETQRDLVTA